MATVRRQGKRVELSATLDRDLLGAVDEYVREHGGLDRSAVLDDAVALWYEKQQERAMEEQYSTSPDPEDERERDDWRAIQTAAAARLFRPR